jgi:RNA recognition motif-containing protein
LDSVFLKLRLVTDDIHRSLFGRSDHSNRKGVRIMGRKLYVGNLPFETGEDELRDLFSRAGAVESVAVMRDQATGRGRGFAFVEMSTDEEAQTAIRELNESQLGGRSLTVNEARPRPARGGPGGGGGPSHRRRSEPRW